MRNLFLYILGSLGLAVFSLPFLMDGGRNATTSTDGTGIHSVWTNVGTIPVAPVADEDDQSSTDDNQNGQAASSDKDKNTDDASGSGEANTPSSKPAESGNTQGRAAPPVSTRRHPKVRIDLSDLVIRPV